MIVGAIVLYEASPIPTSARKVMNHPKLSLPEKDERIGARRITVHQEAGARQQRSTQEQPKGADNGIRRGITLYQVLR